MAGEEVIAVLNVVVSSGESLIIKNPRKWKDIIKRLLRIRYIGYQDRYSVYQGAILGISTYIHKRNTEKPYQGAKKGLIWAFWLIA